jgi:hypothetical protein
MSQKQLKQGFKLIILTNSKSFKNLKLKKKRKKEKKRTYNL